MHKLRVMTVFGTRPEAIKMAPILQRLEMDDHYESIVVITAQHREMLDQVLDLFTISPDIDLNLMKTDQSLASLTASIFTHLDPVLQDKKPDWLLVQGDTTTVMAASLNAFYHQIKVGHVEAGLRTDSKWEPFPEEINRRIAGTIADLHFAPTTWAKSNLLREGIPSSRVHVTGNTIIDVLNQIKIKPMPVKIDQFLAQKGIKNDQKKLIVVTAHRRENFGTPLENICAALRALADQFKDQIEIVYPVHMNPNVQNPVHHMLDGINNITLLPPLDYLSLIHLLMHAYLILTDSGGIQEEATGLKTPCLVLRDVTERPEGIQAGILKLIGTNRGTIIKEAARVITDHAIHQAIADIANPYGDGNAAEEIVSLLI